MPPILPPTAADASTSSPVRARAAVLMVQGTSSHAGKSTVVAGLCRIFADEGLRVAPFKAQNMSLNAAVTPDGGEIGRAQYTQALAARTVPSVLMNPILLKPTDERRSQIVVLGRATDTLGTRDYYARRDALWSVVTESLDTLRATHDVVVIEGAGSPAEINLAQYDIVNMRVARHADAPVLLVGDIERGGVFASLFGTAMLLPDEDRARIMGFVINKFRGDPTLLDPGFVTLLERTGIATLGVLPWMDVALPEEDSLGVPDAPRATPDDAAALLDIAIVRLPHLANFDDFAALAREPGVRVRYVTTAAELGDADLVIVPGTKSTMADLTWLRARGLDTAIADHRARQQPVLGICGGFQMLGRVVRDPAGVESSLREMAGVALLGVTTTFALEKVTRPITGHASSAPGWLGITDVSITGYEIHMGQTTRDEDVRSALELSSGKEGTAWHEDGALDAEGLTMGTYVHGLLTEPSYRRRVLSALATRRRVTLPPPSAEADPFDAVADRLREHLDLATVRRAMGLT